MSELAQIAIERRPEATVARLSGEVDLSNAARVRERLLEAAARGSDGLVVDVSAAEYLDSAWFAVVHDLARDLAGAPGGGLHLVCASGAPARRALELSGLERMVPLHPDLEAGLAAVARARGGGPG